MENSTRDSARRRAKRQANGWQRVLFHWRLPLIVVLVLLVLCAALTMAASSAASARAQAKKADQEKQTETQITYEQAVVDALQAEQTEVKPLVSLTKEDGNVTYDDQTDRVLLAFWTDKPEAFQKEQQASLEGYTYAYADLELAKWGAANKDVLKNSGEKRLKQLFGLPESRKDTSFILAWVTPERVQRAAYQPDAQDGKMSLSFEETVDQDYITWFDGEITANYFTTPRPWTRLGYTYDWGRTGDDHYGVTEFAIPAGTKVTVKDILTNEQAITQLRKGKLGQ